MTITSSQEILLHLLFRGTEFIILTLTLYLDGLCNDYNQFKFKLVIGFKGSLGIAVVNPQI